eukprot:5083769-Pyramimonas_sp.AAC.1
MFSWRRGRVWGAVLARGKGAAGAAPSRVGRLQSCCDWAGWGGHLLSLGRAQRAGARACPAGGRGGACGCT